MGALTLCLKGGGGGAKVVRSTLSCQQNLQQASAYRRPGLFSSFLELSTLRTDMRAGMTSGQLRGSAEGGEGASGRDMGAAWPVLRNVTKRSVVRTPPPCPTLCRSLWGGGGGASLGQHKNFCCGSLCYCVGDCVVRHCHLYPLYSWQDILLTFTEMELDSTTMFTPGTNVIIFIRSTGEPVLVQVIG